MTDAASRIAEQDPHQGEPPAGGAGPGGHPGDGGQLSASERYRQAIARKPWLASANLLAWLVMLAAAGCAARLLIVPGPVVATAVLAGLTTAIPVPWYLAYRPHDKPEDPLADGLRPGEAPPAGVPAATMEAATRIFSRFPSRRWRGARLQVAPCTDPVRHGKCQWASVAPGRGGMLTVVLGEHIASRPGDAAFTLAHEVRHPAGWTCHLSLLAGGARQAGWLVAGWAVPWPWLPAAVAAVQAAFAAACWVTEAACYVGAARAEGRDSALGFIADRRALNRQPKPGPPWRRHAARLLVAVAVPAAHPPWWLRGAIIRALVPGGRRA